MISKVEHTECYVYITLPGQMQAVTAGRFVLTVDKRGLPLGRFVYGKRYLERPDAVALDPVELKLSSQVYETRALRGVFGVLRDAGPDYWGRRIIEHHSGKLELSEIDYLLFSPDDRAGALSFGLNLLPPAPKREFNQTLDLSKLQKIANRVITKENVSIAITNNQITDLLLIGTSMGGARPKAVVEDNEGLWIAKFNRTDDKWNQVRVERTMLVLARRSGLQVADSKIVEIGGQDVLLVKRFDREKKPEGYLRARMISALTVLRAEDTYQSRDRWSYIFLAEELRRISAEPEKDAAELFRRMCFNALISNTDDHPRNHAVIAKDQDWRLSPAYDLTPSMPVSTERRDLAMVCGSQGRFANAENLLSQHARFLLELEQAKSILSDMESVVEKHWYAVARAEGVSDADCEKISSAFVYPGFTL
ncbi:MAG TPA: HipA domain-containing protein [Gammaproteobacteria bacterium]|jgi:serine/threonine-protein kinase HipA|nr:HipA domain-containing protein [Gammaproteobacteria bacterium]